MGTEWRIFSYLTQLSGDIEKGGNNYSFFFFPPFLKFVLIPSICIKAFFSISAMLLYLLFI